MTLRGTRGAVLGDMDDLVKLLYRPLAARAARRVLVGRVRERSAPERGRFSRRDVDSLLEGAWKRYGEERGTLPAQPTTGSTMNVRLACFTFSFFQAMLAVGTERRYAIELVSDAAWNVYLLWAHVASWLHRFKPGTHTALAFANVGSGDDAGAVSLGFPFNAPGYVIQPVRARRGTAFDVVHCPVATYFRKHDAADLCVSSWCNLDYALSELTHATLVRTKTLVQGADHCDFRIVPEDVTMA